MDDPRARTPGITSFILFSLNPDVLEYEMQVITEKINSTIQSIKTESY